MVYAYILLSRIRSHFQELCYRAEWIYPRQSTTDCIATLRMISDQREHCKPSSVADVNFHAAFNSVDRQSLWLLLESKGIPQKHIDLLEDLYSNICVRADGLMSEWFAVSAGVHQGCIVAPTCF